MSRRDQVMSVQEIDSLHQRYVELSARFKSAWTFHQFLQGLHKLLMDGEMVQHSAEFQATFALLKEVSPKLNAATTNRVRNELDMVDRRLLELNRWLLREDTRVSPSLMRLFFQRARNDNETIILQLVKFYLFARPQLDWAQDHNDKVDFLVTRLAEESQSPRGPWILRSRSQTRQIFAGLWRLVGAEEPAPEEVRQHCEEVVAYQRRIAETASFDELVERQWIREYREAKLALGPLFFHPEILLTIVESNLALRNHIQQLYRREEQSIAADCQRIFELEQQVHLDFHLDQELVTFRQQVELFERSLENASLSLEELGRVRQQARSLIPRLTELHANKGLLTESEGFTLEEPSVAEPDSSLALDPEGGVGEEVLEKYRAALCQAIEGVGESLDPEAASVSPDLFSLRLEPREVVAHRRLARDQEVANRELEAFVLWAAALRSRMAEEVEEIRGILDDSAVTREAPVYKRARRTVRLANRYLGRFEHEIDREILGGGLEEAQQLQVLRMRMMREMAGLWLLVHRPRTGSRATRG